MIAMPDKMGNESNKIRRRDFLIKIGWAGIWFYISSMTFALARFFYPRVLFEPPHCFKAGYPEEYTIGVVNTNYQQTNRVWIVREEEGFYALLARCTHLGCTPVWSESENKFKCPCHGSGFTREGINYEGPAPRPLERVKITLADDGQIIIDTGIIFRQERGEWEKTSAYLRV